MSSHKFLKFLVSRPFRKFQKDFSLTSGASSMCRQTPGVQDIPPQGSAPALHQRRGIGHWVSGAKVAQKDFRMDAEAQFA